MGLFGFSLIIFLRRTVAPEANTGLLLAALCIALLVLPFTINATALSLASLPEELRLLGPRLIEPRRKNPGLRRRSGREIGRASCRERV